MVGSSDDKLLIEPVRRVAAFERLAEEPATRAELEDHLDVSRATLHRVVTFLEDTELAVERDGVVALTTAGEAIADAVIEYADRVATAEQVAPLLNCIDRDEHPVPPSARTFADAEVWLPEPSQPHRPARRVVEAIAEADHLRGLSAVVLPSYVEALGAHFEEGGGADLVLASGVVGGLDETYSEQFATARANDRLTARVHDWLPHGLLLTEDRICVAGYDDDGVLQAVVEGDDERLRSWAERCFEQFWTASEPLAGE